MNIEKSPARTELTTGQVTGTDVLYSRKTLGQLAGVFADEAARSAMDPDTVVYEVLSRQTVPEGTPGAKLARLDTRPIAVRDGLTLTEVTLHTGRAHQIRVQHAHAGFPLWGDARYGGGKPGQQIALWAASLALEHPTKHERMQFTSAPPSEGAWLKFAGEIRAYMEDMEA